jgi:phosphoserine phosphatase
MDKCVGTNAGLSMTHVATLIAKPGALDQPAVDRARSLLPQPGAPQWLAEKTAADIPFSPESAADQRALAERVRAALSGTDVVIQPASGRRKKLFLADMDSTMIAQECIDELADRAGIKAHIAAITERAMRGEIAFEPALRERVGLLKGLPRATIDEVIRERITLTPGARELIATMRRNGTHTVMVSGGFTQFTDRIAEMIGFHENRANVLEIDGDTIAGTVAEPIFGRDAKKAALIELRTQLKLGKAETLAIGDGANDMDMIEEAGLGVAYHAKPRVAEAAPARIDHGDLTALLYLQGYRREEFASVA